MKLNRRGFMMTTASIAALPMLGAAPTNGFAASPKRGGLLRIGQLGGATSDTLDPATFAAGPVACAMYGGVYNSLVEIDADNNVVPELAESFEPSADAKTWVFKLRKGITFSDGKPFSAQDVIATFNYHKGDDSKSGGKELLSEIETIRADGTDTLLFQLKGGNADFPFVLADYHFSIMQAQEDGKVDWRSAIGTGGYILESFEPGIRIRLKRRDGYWKTDRAWFDEVELLTINDPVARQNALMSGEVDAIDRIDPKTAHMMQRAPNITLEEVVGLQHYTMPMFCDVKPFSDINVRLALKYAVDREEMVEKLLRGHGSVGNDHPIGAASRFYANGLPQRSYDPDKARFHLKKANAEGLSIELSAAEAAFTGAVDAAVLFQQSAAKAGIQVSVKREPDDGYWSNVWLTKPFCFSYWGGRVTEDWMFTQVYARGAKWNESHWNNDRFNSLLIEARSELDVAKRREMYTEMQVLCSEDGGSIIPMFANFLDARNDKVAHGKLASNLFFDGWKIVERWWPA
ncbi:ABC transporter substrate-binding protein [Pararhizobium sp. YC-54]|uniref:ABC transporter substrate-binding protein n=1 Tax=Pararhizobium sp. YC-54 TaxID=2986920 RepID=UPI0021F7377C|nr:ABC transporter substrate-binding protein [Pararhizobium sp. YC-54]MCW0001744.1 ABC transporter substrate-binding protein [Pararhizobium sp. YC-54]